MTKQREVRVVLDPDKGADGDFSQREYLAARKREIEIAPDPRPEDLVTEKDFRVALSIWARTKQVFGGEIPYWMPAIMGKLRQRAANLAGPNREKATRAEEDTARHKAMAAEILEHSPWLKGNDSELARAIAKESRASVRTIRRHLSKK